MNANKNVLIEKHAKGLDRVLQHKKDEKADFRDKLER